MWMALRPEEEPVPEAIAGALDAFWAKYEADLAFCDPMNGPGYQ